MNIFHEESAFCLAQGVRLRREPFGGLLYDARNGTTIDVDKSAFQLLRVLDGGACRIGDALAALPRGITMSGSTVKTLRKLRELKIIETTDAASMPLNPVCQESDRPVNRGSLSAPETIHWAVTYRCDRRCIDCYTRRFPHTMAELDTAESKKLIDLVADWGVFQLAMGGGEPLMREDVPLLIRHAGNRGLSVHLTTARLRLDPSLLEALQSSGGTLQTGIQADMLLGRHVNESVQQLRDLFEAAGRYGITPGANLIMTRSVVGRLQSLINILQESGFTRIILLRYKPPISLERWKVENPELCDMKGLHERIAGIAKENPHLKIRIDCAASFLHRHLPAGMAEQSGLRGCVAADRILAVAPDGTAYPCSQLVHPAFRAGNLLESGADTVWNSRILRKYRSFRTNKSFRHSACGVCKSRTLCGGCRVFANDGIGGDPGCPEPNMPLLTQLGETGRSLDLAGYLQTYGAISVGEYMGRYEVSQKKAVKELASSAHTSCTGKSAGRKTDVYRYNVQDMVAEIQASIGFTSGGFPFVPYEELARNLESPAYLEAYPLWIRYALRRQRTEFEASRKRSSEAGLYQEKR